MEWEEKWTMRGIDKDDPRCIASKEALADFIEKTGFLPLFRNEIPGFSVEENVCPEDWWTDDEEKDPWIWRMALAETGRFVYGKFFNGCAGFVSKEWFPFFACIRRNGYDFDSRADEGLAKKRDADVMRLFEGGAAHTISSIRTESHLTKGLDGTLQSLQHQTYLLVSGFTRKVNKRGEPYGWSISVYQTPESIWGYDFVTSGYNYGEKECAARITGHLCEMYPDIAREKWLKMIL